jgi:hypothetical protein
MDMINRNNYEIYFLDALEGNLAPHLEKQLQDFLVSHPDLAEEFMQMQEAMNNSAHDTPLHIYPDKEKLHKPGLPINRKELDTLLIDELENVLPAEEKAQLEKWSAVYPEVDASRRMFAATILQPTEDTFDAKGKLKVGDAPDYSDHNILLAAAAENDLQPAQIAQLGLDSTANDSVLREIELLKKLKLRPGTESFDAKDTLRKREARIIPFRKIALTFTSAAAVLLMLFTIVQRNDTHPAEFALTPGLSPNLPMTQTPASKNNETLVSSQKPTLSGTNTLPASHSNIEYTSSVATSFVNGQNAVMPELRTPSEVSPIGSLPVNLLALNDEKGLMLPTPDMRLVHEQPVANPVIAGENKTMNLIEYLSKAAGKKLEDSYAYSLASRQYSRLTERSEESVQIKKSPEKEKVTIRIAGLEIERDVAVSPKKENGLVQRAERIYNKLRPAKP